MDRKKRDQMTIMVSSTCTTSSFLLRWFNKIILMKNHLAICKRCKNCNSSEKTSSWMPLLLYRFQISSIMVKLKEVPKTKTMASNREPRVEEARAFRNYLISSFKAWIISYSLKIWTWWRILTKRLLKTQLPTRLAWLVISRTQQILISNPRRSHIRRDKTQGIRKMIHRTQKKDSFKKLIACVLTEIRSMSTRKFSNPVES